MTVNIHGTFFLNTDPNKESLAMNLVNKNTVRILKSLGLILLYILNMAYCF